MRWALLLAGALSALAAGAQTPPPHVPAVADIYGDIAERFQGDYDVILQPDTLEPEWWAGAPSVVRDGDGVFWMACRMRTAESPRGLRGYEVRILRSEDGVVFEKVKSIHRDDVPIPGFERPALLIDPETKQFKLYLCGPWEDGHWSIIKLDDADSPEDFVPSTARPVIQAFPKTFERDIVPHEYKDPYITFANGAYHCYVTGYIRRNEWLFHWTSEDGEAWEPVGDFREPMMDLSGWHNFFIRPGCVVPMGAGYLFVYEGSHSSWADPVYNVATGLGWTFDLHTIIDLTPDVPIAMSATPSERFATFRYSHWIIVDDELWVYAEVTRPDNAHEIRLIRLPMN